MCECLPIEFQMFSPSSQTSDDDIIWIDICVTISRE
jgi:hypothetical protein